MWKYTTAHGHLPECGTPTSRTTHTILSVPNIAFIPRRETLELAQDRAYPSSRKSFSTYGPCRTRPALSLCNVCKYRGDCKAGCPTVLLLWRASRRDNCTFCIVCQRSKLTHKYRPIDAHTCIKFNSELMSEPTYSSVCVKSGKGPWSYVFLES